MSAGIIFSACFFKVVLLIFSSVPCDDWQVQEPAL
jgi:hypothetical protein